MRGVEAPAEGETAEMLQIGAANTYATLLATGSTVFRSIYSQPWPGSRGPGPRLSRGSLSS